MFINPYLKKELKEDFKAAVVYASHSGNAELVAQAVWDGLNSRNISVELLRAEKTDITQLAHNDLIVLVCSTYNVGQLNEKFIKLNDELAKLILPDKYIEIIGLGDSQNYDIFCGAADILEDTVSKTQAKRLAQTLRLDGPPHHKLQEIKGWAIQLVNKLLIS